MGIELKVLCGVCIGDYLDRLAQLRQSIRKAGPYIDESALTGAVDCSNRFAHNLGAIVVTVQHEGRIVGAACGEPLIHEEKSLGLPLTQLGEPIEDFFHLDEIFIEEQYRSEEIEARLFAAIEFHAQEIGFSRVSFYTKPETATRPHSSQTADSFRHFWRARGYYPLKSAAGPQQICIWMKDLATKQTDLIAGEPRAISA